MSASTAAARAMAIILVAASVGSTRGGRIGRFDGHAPLDTVVPTVSYIQVALSVYDDAVVVEEFARTVTVEDATLAGCSTGRVLVDWSAVRRKLDHAPVVRIRDIHVAVSINGNSAGQVYLARAVAV